MTKEEELAAVKAAYDIIDGGRMLDDAALYDLAELETAEGVKALLDTEIGRAHV